VPLKSVEYTTPSERNKRESLTRGQLLYIIALTPTQNAARVTANTFKKSFFKGTYLIRNLF